VHGPDVARLTKRGRRRVACEVNVLRSAGVVQKLNAPTVRTQVKVLAVAGAVTEEATRAMRTPASDLAPRRNGRCRHAVAVEWQRLQKVVCEDARLNRSAGSVDVVDLDAFAVLELEIVLTVEVFLPGVAHQRHALVVEEAVKRGSRAGEVVVVVVVVVAVHVGGQIVVCCTADDFGVVVALDVVAGDRFANDARLQVDPVTCASACGVAPCCRLQKVADVVVTATVVNIEANVAKNLIVLKFCFPL